MINTELRKEWAQRNFDFYIWNGSHLPSYEIEQRLINGGFTRSEAKRSYTFIVNQTMKAVRDAEKGIYYGK